MENTTAEAILTALSIMIDKYLGDKVYGRRNYAIITYDNRFFKLGWGEAKRRNLLCWRIADMGQHNIHMWAFTYKADWDNCANRLKELNYSEI